MSPPSLSIYVPAYNVAPYVRETVESILAQTHGDFELIIINDGSKDGTLAVLEELAGKDSRIRLIDQMNAGVSETANRAIQLARSEFVARVDGDDVVHPQRMEKQLAYLQANPECVAVGTGMLLIDEAGWPLYPMAHIEFGHEKIDAVLLNGGWPIAQPASMYRRSAVLGVGGYRPDLSLHEDHDLFLKLAEQGRLENLPEVLTYYRQRSTSLVAMESASSHTAVMGSILKEARQRRGLPEDLPIKESPMPLSTIERFRRWAWRSLKAGHVKTARKYGWETLRRDPLSSDSWKLMYCALRGR